MSPFPHVLVVVMVFSLLKVRCVDPAKPRFSIVKSGEEIDTVSAGKVLVPLATTMLSREEDFMSFGGIKAGILSFVTDDAHIRNPLLIKIYSN